MKVGDVLVAFRSTGVGAECLRRWVSEFRALDGGRDV